jgi:predicted transcriptional regulator
MSASPFSIRLDPTIKARLEKAAQREGRSSGSVVQRALEQYLDAEDMFRKEMERVDKALDEGAFVSWGKVEAWIESWDTENELPEPEPDIFRNR